MSGNNGKTGVVMIKTAEKQEDIISNGMLAVNIRLNLDRVNDCKYVICCQDNAEDSEELFTDSSGFLIGIIKDTRRLPNGSSVIYLSEFATIYREDMWTKRHGIPLQYFASPTDCGMYAGRVNFKKLDAIETVTSEIVEVKPAKITAPERSFPIASNFKTLIASAFGVKPSDIESAVIVFKANDGKVTVEI